MKLQLPRLLAAAVLASLVSAPAYTAEIPDEYKDNTVLVRDADYLADYASNASTDYVAFLLDMDIEVPSDISLDGGNLYFTSRNAQLPVSLAFTGSDSAALTDLSSLVFDTLSGLSFTSYKKGAIDTSGNLIIQNVNDGVEDSENPDVFFSGNTFSSSYSDSYGDAIYAYSGVSISGNGDVTFTENSASSRGGAIYAYSGVSISGNGDVTFTGNTVSSSSSSSYGGAIYASSVNITGNGDVSFSWNSASSSSSGGGAIYASEDVSISGNGDVSFTGNSASSSSDSRGGAIYARSGGVSISGNGDVTFTENSASSLGGAIYAYSGVSISGNGDVSFTGNTVSSSSDSRGGAIRALGGDVIISGNEDVSFTGNAAPYSSSYYSSGGAIYAEGVSIIGNGEVTFMGNSASSSADYESFTTAYGGAIHASENVSISGNVDVTFMGNSASSSSDYESDAHAYGGAIDASEDVSITANGAVLFSGNSASSSDVTSYPPISLGGAIQAYRVSIIGNETVCFEKNYESVNSTYRLRSIYTGGDLNLSAKTGGHITIYDSVYGGTTSLNADYTDAEGNTQQAKGNIIFSGQYTKTHLDAILEANHEGRVATDEEILNSRTSTLGNMTLYGGTLQVVDGAILSTTSLTVAAGSSASVLLRDAELKGTVGITFNAGTTLQVQGDSLITGYVLLLAGSSLDIDGAITINGGLTLEQGLTLSGDILADIRNLQAGQSLTLVSGLESLAVQTQELVRSVEYATVQSGQELVAAEHFSNLQGVGNLVLVYDETAGTVKITQTVPEPTTATLSLLALVALASRRRRN